MTKRASPSYFLRNPITGECRGVTAHEARRLRAYEWTPITLAQYKAYQVARWADRYTRYYTDYQLRSH